MRILITGAGGQIGQALQKVARQKRFSYLAATKSQLDITSEEAISRAIQHYQPHVLINAAAYTNVEQAEILPNMAYAVNADAAGLLARICQSYDIPLLHISTDYVFSGEKRLPYVEEADAAPVNLYGKSKLAGEYEILAASDKNIILRTSWVFSATGKNFFTTMCNLFREREEVRVVNDQYGCPTSAESVAIALLNMAEQCSAPFFDRSLFGVYHFCGEREVTWYDFACAIRDIKAFQSKTCSRILPVTSDEFFSRARRPVYSVLNTEKIRKVFDIHASDWQKDLHAISYAF